MVARDCSKCQLYHLKPDDLRSYLQWLKNSSTIWAIWILHNNFLMVLPFTLKRFQIDLDTIVLSTNQSERELTNQSKSSKNLKPNLRQLEWNKWPHCVTEQSGNISCSLGNPFSIDGEHPSISWSLIFFWWNGSRHMPQVSFSSRIRFKARFPLATRFLIIPQYGILHDCWSHRLAW